MKVSLVLQGDPLTLIYATLKLPLHTERGASAEAATSDQTLKEDLSTLKDKVYSASLPLLASLLPDDSTAAQVRNGQRSPQPAFDGFGPSR